METRLIVSDYDGAKTTIAFSTKKPFWAQIYGVCDSVICGGAVVACAFGHGGENQIGKWTGGMRQ